MYPKTAHSAINRHKERGESIPFSHFRVTPFRTQKMRVPRY